MAISLLAGCQTKPKLPPGITPSVVVGPPLKAEAWKAVATDADESRVGRLGLAWQEALADANKAIDFVGRWVVPSPSREGPDYKTKVGYYVVKGRVLEQIGTYEMKTDCHQAFLDMCLRELGPDHRQTTRALNGLEHHYRRSGKIDEADKVHTELEERWARLCETEENHGRAAGPT